MSRILKWLFPLAVLAVAAAACTSTQEPTATSPAPTATSASSGSSVTPASTPADGDISPELTELLAEVDRRMAAIRGIPIAEPVPFRFLNDEELDAYVREQIDDPEFIVEIGQADAIYKLLGLIDDNSDLFEEYAALLDAQVLGAYDPELEEFVVLQPGEQFGPSQEFTYAHEYIHRLQDAKFDLDQLSENVEHNSDKSLALTAVVEGDATSAQQSYALQHLGLDELAQILREAEASQSGIPTAPHILSRGLEFPYVEGTQFIERLRVIQGPEAVDRAFTNPPDSTEQILHIEKFVQRELPLEVTLPETLFAAEGPLGPGWEIVDDDVLGEFFIRAWLEAIGARSTDAAEAGAGWGGDSYQLGRDEGGQHAFALKVRWDDPARDADQLFVVLTTIMDASPEFRRVDVGPDVGVRAYRSGGGVIVTATFGDPGAGVFSVVTAADDLQTAMALALALAMTG